MRGMSRRGGVVSDTCKSKNMDTGLAAHLRGTTMLAGVAVAAMIAGAPAKAQEAETASGEGARTAPISVTATRTPMEAFHVPGQVTVKGAEEIENAIPSALGDLFDDVPGVTSFGGPRRTGEVPSIRGFSGADVIVTLDGARQNFVSGHDGRAFIDPAFLGEAEIVRGSSSSLYGSGGTGGVIALRTIRAEDLLDEGETFGGRAGLTYRSGNDEFAQRLIGVAKPNDLTDLSGGIVRRRSHDIRLGNGNEITADDDILSGFLRGTFETENGAGIKLGWNRFTNEAKEPNNGQAATGTDADKDVNSETFNGGFFFDPKTNPFLDAEVNFYKVKTSVNETNLTGASANQLQERQIRTFGFDAENTSRFMLGSDAGVAVTAGLDYYQEEAEGALNGGVRGGVVTGDQQVYGFFVQSAFTFYDVLGLEGSEFSITPGVRYDEFKSKDTAGNSESDNQLSPKITASFAPVSWASSTVPTRKPSARRRWTSSTRRARTSRSSLAREPWWVSTPSSPTRR